MISEFSPIKVPVGGSKVLKILADNGQKCLAVFSVANCAGGAPDCGRIISDIVIAGQIDAVDRKGCMQLLGEFEIVAVGRRVEGDIAGADDEVGSRRVDVLADALEISGEFLIAAGEVGVGNSRRNSLMQYSFRLTKHGPPGVNDDEFIASPQDQKSPEFLQLDSDSSEDGSKGRRLIVRGSRARY